MIFKPKQKAWVEGAAAAGFPAGTVVGYAEIDSICESMGGVTRPWWLINDKNFRAGRGKFMIPAEGAPSLTQVDKANAKKEAMSNGSAPMPVLDGKDTAVPNDLPHAAPSNVVSLAKASSGIDAAGAIDILGASTLSIDAVDDSNITVTASAKDLDIAVAGGGTQELRLTSAGTGASAMHLNASAGGINVDSADMIDIDAADFNQDGLINVIDIVNIVNFILN